MSRQQPRHIKMIRHHYSGYPPMLELCEQSDINGKWYALCLHHKSSDIKEYLQDHGLPYPTIIENCEHI